METCLREFRCNDCHKLLFKGVLVEGTVEVKCKHCHSMQTIHSSTAHDLICMVSPCPNRIFLPEK